MNFEKIFRLLDFKRASFDNKLDQIVKQYLWKQLSYETYNNAIWFLGCSHVYGIGVNYNENAAYILDQQTDRKVINLGLSACGPLMIEHQIDFLIEKNIIPYAIIIAWPDMSRWQSFDKNNNPVFWTIDCLSNRKIHNNHLGCKKLFPKDYENYKNLILNNKIVEVNQNTINRVRNKIQAYKHIEFTYIKQPDVDVDQLCEWIDLGSDGTHCGPRTQKLIADKLWDKVRTWN